MCSVYEAVLPRPTLLSLRLEERVPSWASLAREGSSVPTSGADIMLRTCKPPPLCRQDLKAVVSSACMTLCEQNNSSPETSFLLCSSSPFADQCTDGGGNPERQRRANYRKEKWKRPAGSLRSFAPSTQQ
ncbi:transient receptor potential cation channel subfamily M member 7 [Platysternon megacephalum]|uniref:Transient receptor potential cation channel subfamily M member 7 n=1 Tax=Platysternon megacephalum TaxID=55544 RepID=A0A4D9F1Y6_9SAUR|nr:transient receptor potential cation channel subfamily M member 7 [Platysternon megacephalum]